MALSVRDQLTYWGLAGAVFFAILWLLGDVLLPFVLGAALAYFLDPIADKLENFGLSRVMAVLVIALAVLIVLLPAVIFILSTLTQQVAALGSISLPPDFISGIETISGRAALQQFWRSSFWRINVLGGISCEYYPAFGDCSCGHGLSSFGLGQDDRAT